MTSSDNNFVRKIQNDNMMCCVSNESVPYLYTFLECQPRDFELPGSHMCHPTHKVHLCDISEAVEHRTL
jgi:hypothetical protein